MCLANVAQNTSANVQGANDTKSNELRKLIDNLFQSYVYHPRIENILQEISKIWQNKF